MYKSNYLILFLICNLLVNSLFSKSWQEIFNEKEIILNDNSYNIIKGQYKTVIANQSLVIACAQIKKINIKECDEDLIDIKLMNNPRIEMLPNDLNKKPFASADCNSGLPSASKMRLTLWNKLQTMIEALDELAENFGYKKGKICIRVFEGLRDLETQAKLFKNKFNEIKNLNKSLSDQELELETSKWVAPVKNNVPPHSTGAAIDIRLWNNETNDFVDLGKFGVIWGTNPCAPTFSENITDEQKLNRLYLLMAAAKAGLINYSYEYWHFSFGDRYAVYWTQKDELKRYAIYGSK